MLHSRTERYDTVTGASVAPRVPTIDTNSPFLQRTPGRAALDRGRAAVSDSRLRALPFVVKDVFDVCGTRTTSASHLYDGARYAPADSEAVRRLSAAGGVCVGKTVMSELAYSVLGVNERFGTPTVWRDGIEYLVGGSSSGSAAAVHQGIAPIGLASDTSGSARVPAAWTGLHGFRPSLGRYPTRGMTPLASSLDTAALITDTLEHLDLADQILSRRVASGAQSSPPQFLVPDDEYLARCDDEVLHRFHRELDRLRASGHAVEHRRIAALHVTRDAHRDNIPIVESEALASYGRFLDQPDLLSQTVRRRLIRARSRSEHASSAPLYAAQKTLRAQFRAELADAVLLTPVAEIDPPAYHLVRESVELHDELNSRALTFTMELSYLDAPSLVVPRMSPEHTAPACLQLSMSAGRDAEVIAAARHLATS